MLLDALHAHGPRRSCASSPRAAVQRFAGMEPGRPVGGAYYLYRTLRQLDADGLVGAADGSRRSERRRGRRGRVRRPARARGVRGPAQGAAGDDRGRDPPPARRRPRRRGDGAHAAQAAARGRRLHARVARGDAAAAAGDLPADARARGPARAAPPAPPPRAPRLPPDRARTRCRTAACPPSRSSSTRARRSPRSWSSPTSPARSRASPASRCSSSTRWQSEFSKVRSWVFIDGIDEVTRFFDESEDVERGDPPGEHRGRRRVGRRPLRLRPRVRGVARAPHPRGHDEDVDHPARRRAQQLPRVAGLGRRRDAQARPAACSGSTPSRAATGTPATRSSPSTAVLRRRVRVPQPAPAPRSSSAPSPRASAPRPSLRRYRRSCAPLPTQVRQRWRRSLYSATASWWSTIGAG